MKQKMDRNTAARFRFKRLTARQVWALLPFPLSLAVALLSGLLLFSATVMNALTNAIIATGLDQLRAQLIAALMMSMACAFTGALVGRRKLGAVVGAGIVFCLGYLPGFVQLELQPVYDAGGHLEPLDTGALVHTLLVMLALGLLSGFCGSAIGAAMGEVVLNPLYVSGRALLRRFTGAQKTGTGEAVGSVPAAFKQVYGWIGVIGMVVLLVLASSSGDLFLFSPDIGLHTSPDVSSGQGATTHGTILQDSLVSPALGGRRQPFLIYLPLSYNTSQGSTERYPTLYLLHGSPGSDLDWFRAGKAAQSADTLIALKEIPELIIVSPDGNGFERGTSEWGNSFDQQQQMETFVARDLVRYVDAKYRTIPEVAYRGIGGLSMGGFGAANIGVHHPDVFGFALAMGGYYRADGIIWGNSASYKRQNSPLDVLPTDKRAWKLQFYLADGFQDHPYYEDTIQFAQELSRLHIRYHLDQQNGHHSWALWQVFLYKALLWLQWGTS